MLSCSPEGNEEWLEGIRERVKGDYQGTVFKETVWSDPPIRGPHGLAKIKMKPGVVPIRQRPFMLTGERREAMVKAIEEFENLGLLEPSISPWLSPAFPVKKKEAGKWRLVVDYRVVNQGTIPDSYPLPRIEEILTRQGQFCIWSVLDMKQGYHQVPYMRIQRR